MSDGEQRTARAIRLAIATFATLLLGTTVASIHLSTLDLSFGTLVYGSATLWRDHDAAFRVAALDPRTLRLLRGLRAEVRLLSDGQPIATGRAEGDEIAELSLRVPRNAALQAEIEVELATAHGGDRVRFPARVVSETGALNGKLTTHAAALARGAGATKADSSALRLYPTAGHVVAGFANPVIGVLGGGGAPPPAPVHVTNAALGLAATAGPHGTLRFLYTPPPNPTALDFDITPQGGAVQRARVPLDVRPSQLLLETKPAVLVTPGAILAVRVRGLASTSPVHVDVWVGDALLLATTDVIHGAPWEFDVVLPQAARGAVRIEAYRNLPAPEGTLARRILWASADAPAAALSELQAALARLPGGDPVLHDLHAAQGDERLLLAEAALSRVEPTTAGMPLLASSMQRRQTTVDADLAAQRRTVHQLLVATIVLGLGLLVAFAVRHQLRVRTAVRHVVSDGIAAGEDLDHQSADKLARLAHTYDLWLALAGLALAGYALYVLLTRMRWQYF